MKPWMHPDEIKKIQSYLKPEMKVIEWGCGGSTLKFGGMVAKYVSIEHEPAWASKVRAELKDPNVTIITIPVSGVKIDLDAPYYSEEYTEAFKLYSQPERLKEFAPFDAAIIDGRSRRDCAIFAANELMKGGPIFIHDFFLGGRGRYGEVLDQLELVDEVRTLAVLKPIGWSRMKNDLK